MEISYNTVKNGIKFSISYVPDKFLSSFRLKIYYLFMGSIPLDKIDLSRFHIEKITKPYDIEYAGDW